MSAETAKPANRRPFLLVLLLFFAPLLIAFAVYYGSGWRPSGTTNKGELITPAIPLPEVSLTTLRGAPADKDVLRKVWTLVYVNEGPCDESCLKILRDLQIVRQMLGKDMGRTAGAAFLLSDGDAQSLPGEMAALRGDDTAGRQLLSAFPVPSEGSLRQAKRIYIIDPLGNLMMSYRLGTDPRDIYQDLKKLLTLSHIG